MYVVLVSNDHTHGYRIADKAGTVYNPLNDQVLSRLEDGELWGGVVYSGYTRASIFTHIAGFKPNWLTRGYLAAFFSYPFNQLECNKIFCAVKGSNAQAQSFVLRLGFRVNCRISGVYPGLAFDGDMVIFEMARNECRWLKEKTNGLV